MKKFNELWQQLHKQNPGDRASKKRKITQEWKSRMDSTQKKMTRGAQNIFRMIKSRTHWGNKELWGNDKKE